MRTCDDCKATMSQGYVIDAGVKYLCEACHPKHYTPEQWAEEYANGESESYWTEWGEEEDEPCRECGEDASEGVMWDYNVWHEEGRSAGDLDAWTYDLDEARQIAADYLARTGVAPVITRHPLRKTPDGWETDPTTFERVN